MSVTSVGHPGQSCLVQGLANRQRPQLGNHLGPQFVALGVGKADQQQVVRRAASLFQVIDHPEQVTLGFVIQLGAAFREPEVHSQALILGGQAFEGVRHRAIKLRLYRNRVLGNEAGFGHQRLPFIAEGEFNQSAGEFRGLVAHGVHEQPARQRVVFAGHGELVRFQGRGIAVGNGQQLAVAHRGQAGETDAARVPGHVVGKLVVGFIAQGAAVQRVGFTEDQGFESIPGAGTVVPGVQTDGVVRAAEF